MFSLYGEVIEVYLVSDLKGVVLKYMCNGIKTLLGYYKKLSRSEDIEGLKITKYQQGHTIASNYCVACIEQIVHPVIVILLAEPSKGVSDRPAYLLCSGCKLLDISIEDYKKYMPFLTLVYPGLTIKL